MGRGSGIWLKEIFYCLYAGLIQLGILGVANFDLKISGIDTAIADLYGPVRVY